MDHFAYLEKVLILLSAAVFIVLIFKRFRLSPVLGYLVAGAAIGENGFGYINSHELSTFAELGVVFLLFAIGLEMTFERLMAMRLHVFGFGTIQVVVTTFLIYLVCRWVADLSAEASIVIGGALALSSTAIVLKVMSDSNLNNTQVGRLSLANLLLQDFAVVPLLVLVPILSEPSETSIAVTLSMSVGKAALVLVAIFILGRLGLRPLYNVIASTKSRELFLAVTLLVVLGTSYTTYQLGLSLAMGAFIAGLLVAETQYQHQVEENIINFKGLLMGLFFSTIGMTIDLGFIYEKLSLIIAVALGLIVLKAVIIIIICKLFRFPIGTAVHMGLLLSQGGEFAFILFGLAASPEIMLITPETKQVMLTVVTLTMAVTPLLSLIGLKFKKYFSYEEEKLAVIEDSVVRDLNRHVVVAGFGEVGHMVCKILTAKKVGYIVMDSDTRVVKKGKEEGFPLYKGDPSKLDSLKAVATERAKAIIVSLPDDVHMKKTIRTIHKHYPDIPIAVRARDLRNAKSLRKMGATIIVPEKYEAGLQLAGSLLNAVGMSDIEVSQLKNQFRGNSYELPPEIKETVS